jgi:hypothetical protein
MGAIPIGRRTGAAKDHTTMTAPRQSRAGVQILNAVKKFPDDAPPEKFVELLVQCSKLADQDITECQTDEQKQKVWFALLSSITMLIRTHGGEAVAIKSLSDAIIAASLGRPHNDSLTSSRIPNTHPLNVEQIRACMIALVDVHPDLQQQTYSDAVSVLGGNVENLKKMRENFRGGRIDNRVLPSYVESAKQQIAEFGYTRLKELI